MAFVDYQMKDNIAVITLNRPDRLNALGQEVTDGIYAAFKKYEEDKDARVVILTGTGRTFSAGADIKEFGKPMIEKQAYYPIEVCPKPVIAAVNGFCLGGGCVVMISCDIRIAAKSATFGMPEVKRVIPLPLYRLLRQGLPTCVATELIMVGEHLTSQRALEIGLINKVVPDEELMPEAMKMAQKLAELSPWAVRQVKEAKIKATSLTEEEFKIDRGMSKSARQTEDFKEAAKAFVEKRKPVFKGK